MFVLKETYVCPQCANHCQVKYEMDGDKLASMDGFLCGSGMTAWVTRLLFPDQQTDTALTEEQSCKQK